MNIPVHVTFVPHLAPMSRGMLTTIYATLTNAVNAEDVGACLQKYYSGRPFVRLCSDTALPDTRNVRNTNWGKILFYLQFLLNFDNLAYWQPGHFRYLRWRYAMRKNTLN